MKYFGNYRILSGILPIDGFGVIHIKIKVVERKNDNLSIQELSEGLHMRLINAFTESDGLYNIPSGYWSENTIYFPNAILKMGIWSLWLLYQKPVLTIYKDCVKKKTI